MHANAPSETMTTAAERSSLRRFRAAVDLVCPGRSAGALRNRAQMMAGGLRHAGRLRRMLGAPPGTALGRALRERPELLGALLWPYQCTAWGPGERLRRIAAHYAEVDRLGPPFPFAMDETLTLEEIGGPDDLFLVLDQPRWFMREGGLTLNLFAGSFRAYSVAFALHRGADGGLSAVIGGIQGRNADNVLDLYRRATKTLHGMRPRDFTLEATAILCRTLGVAEILAVSDATRHHRHRYFGNRTEFPQDYDAIWEDRGGAPLDACLWRLPLTQKRDLSTVKPNKRSLYRRRYDYLDRLEAGMGAALASARPRRFRDT